MTNPLQSQIGNTELLNLYGDEPYGMMTIRRRWQALASRWSQTASAELGEMRQMMLRISIEKGGK